MRKIIAGVLVIALAVLQAFSFASCKSSAKTKYSVYYFDYFDTATQVIGYTETKEEFDLICEDIKSKLNEYHQLFTIYHHYEKLNNLAVINDVTNGKHKVVKVDEKIIDMLTFAKDIYNKTDGKVNVAMGSVLSIWHTYRSKGLDNPDKAELPPMKKLKEANKHTDINDLIIDKEKNTVYLADPLMKLDVGAIAKGYAVEKTGEYLEEKGIEGFLLNVGGNIRSVGFAGAEGKPWKVGIENPDTEDEKNPYIEYLKIAGESIVTSGSYQRFYKVNGESYHHIIDPETLMPGVNFKSVSIVTDDSGLGDAFSTALFLMSYEEGKKLVEETENIEAVWIMPDGEKRYSSGFSGYTL